MGDWNYIKQLKFDSNNQNKIITFDDYLGHIFSAYLSDDLILVNKIFNLSLFSISNFLLKTVPLSFIRKYYLFYEDLLKLQIIDDLKIILNNFNPEDDGYSFLKLKEMIYLRLQVSNEKLSHQKYLLSNYNMLLSLLQYKYNDKKFDHLFNELKAYHLFQDC